MSDFNYMDNLCIILLFQHYSLTARTTFIPGTVWTSLFCLRDDLNISCLSQGRLEHLMFVAGTTWKSHFCCGDDLNISLLLQGRLEHLIILAGTTWKSHFLLRWRLEHLIIVAVTTWTSNYCCGDDMNISYLLQGRLEHLIIASRTVWKSHFCSRDDLNTSFLLQGRLEPGWPEGTDPDPRGPVVQQGEALQGECINKGTVHRNQGNLWTN